MILGILSDSHGDLEITLAAVKLLQDRGAEFLIHCGDVGGEHVLDALAGVPSAFAFGNNDYDHRTLESAASALGIDCLGESGGLELGGTWVGVTHGDNARVLEKMLAADSPYAYVFTGHSHRTHDKRVNGRRWINPGALYRAAVKTVATLDVASDRLDFIEVKKI